MKPDGRNNDVPPAPAVDYARTRCPTCGSARTVVSKTGGPDGGSRVRYHRCSVCLTRFKSVEAVDVQEFIEAELDR